MRRRRNEAGEGQFGCIVGIIILIIGVVAALKIIPAKARSAEVRDTIVDEAKSAGSHGDDRIRKAILKKAEEQELTIADSDIKIARTGGNISVEVSYTVPIQFPGYTYEWHVTHTAANPIF